MEPNTSSSAADWTSPAAVVEHGEPSVRDQSLLSPAFSPAPSPGLLPASGSGSDDWSWYQQIPPSPAAAAGNGSLSGDAHATSSPSPLSSIPTAGTLPMVGYDLFGNGGNPEATAATPLPTLLGGQWEQGESSSMPAPSVLLPECPSPDLFGFAAGESGEWPSEEMSSFFSPSPAGVLMPESSDIDNLVGFAQPSSDPELEALQQSLRMHTLAVEESPVPVVDAPTSLPPIVEEEEEIDVSAFLVSDPEDQLRNASWLAGPQMAGTGTGSGGGASASWMAPGSTAGNNWPPMSAPAVASTCTMASSNSESMACYPVSSSIGVASSMGGMMEPSSAALPLVPPSFQGAGDSSSNFNDFAQQPSLSSVLAPLPPNLHGPLLPVKQEVMEYVDAGTRRHPPDFISLVDDEEDGYNVFGSWGSSSSPPASFAPGSWMESSNGSPSFAPGSWGDGSGSSSPSFAPHSWGRGNGSHSFSPSSWGGSSSGSPGFAPSSWDGSSSGSPGFAPSSWGGSSSSSPSFGSGSWGSSSRSPSFAANYGSSSMLPLSLGRGRMSSISGLPPLPKAGGFSRKYGPEVVFTDPEKAIIAKDEKLQELLRTDPKKVKRMLYNRAYSTTAKVRKVMHTKNLEQLIVTLEEKRKSLRAELQSLEEGSAELMAQKMKMQMIIGELERQTTLKDAVREGLRAQIQNLKHLNPN